MDTILIRPIELRDAECWRALRQALWPDDDHRDEVQAFFRGELAEPVLVLLAVDGIGTIAGFVELSVRNQVPGSGGVRVGFIEGLYVVPAYRGTGVARKLLSASRAWALAQGCDAFASDRADRFIVDRRFPGGPSEV